MLITNVLEGEWYVQYIPQNFEKLKINVLHIEIWRDMHECICCNVQLQNKGPSHTHQHATPVPYQCCVRDACSVSVHPSTQPCGAKSVISKMAKLSETERVIITTFPDKEGKAEHKLDK